MSLDEGINGCWVSLIIGLALLVLPIAVYSATFIVAKKLLPGFCRWYRILGAVLVFGGSGVSVYFAAYTGDQGGIAAFYFQLLVIVIYLLLSMTLVIANWFIQRRQRQVS